MGPCGNSAGASPLENMEASKSMEKTRSQQENNRVEMGLPSQKRNLPRGMML